MLLTAVLAMIGLGVFFGGILAIASEKLKVEEDPRIEELARELPGLNCGACGFPSCQEFAKGIVKGKEEAINSTCRVAGPEVIDFLSRISGVTKKPLKEIAVVLCGAKTKDKTRNANYKGIEICRSANILSGGGMNCEYGCLGYGDCVKACAFDAMKMVDGLPGIDPEKCVTCGKCVTACCRDIIEIMPYDVDNLVVPACKSMDKGARVRKICAVGCIACKVCEKFSGGVICVEDNLAKLKTGRMKEDVNWNEVIKKCPTNTIVRIK